MPLYEEKCKGFIALYIYDNLIGGYPEVIDEAVEAVQKNRLV